MGDVSSSNLTMLDVKFKMFSPYLMIDIIRQREEFIKWIRRKLQKIVNDIR